LLTVIAAGSVYFYFNYTSRISSVAVLPFVNASQDLNAEYLSDGITESIINNLSHLPGSV
jgi:TolB-like protein